MDIFEAIKKQDIETLKTLIANGADVNAKNKEGRTPIQCVVENYDPEIDEEMIKLLVKHGADINALGEFDAPALVIPAAALGDTEACKALLDNGADIKSTTNKGMTALMAAAKNSCTDTCELLIKYGADVNEKNKQNGATALMYAAHDGDTRIETFELLLKHGADVNATDIFGNSALIYAIESVDELYVDPEEAYENCIQICELLIKHGADVNCGRWDLIEDADSDASTLKDVTPLAIAESIQHIEDTTKLCDLLRKHGAQ